MPHALQTLGAITLACCLGATAAAADGSDLWTEDWDAAQETAAANNQDLLIDFTGSDWCTWCIRLHDEAFTTEAFQSSAPSEFVLVSLDFPRTTQQATEIRERNERLAALYQVRGFPTILLTDPQGRAYARTGYQQGGGEAYVAHLDELQAQREVRDGLLRAAQIQDNAEAYQALFDWILQNGLPTAGYEQQMLSFIAHTDADDLQTRHQFVPQVIIQRIVAGDFEQARTDADTILAIDDIDATSQQLATFLKGASFAEEGNEAAALPLMQSALELAPDSQFAQPIQQSIQQLQAQAAAPQG